MSRTLLLAALACAALPAALPAPATATRPAPEAVLHAFAAEQAKAWASGPTDLSGTFHDDAVIFFPEGAVAVGSAAHDEQMEHNWYQRQDAPSKGKASKITVAMLPGGKAAVLTYDLVGHGDYDGGRTDWSMRVTQLLVERDDTGWRALAACFSVPESKAYTPPGPLPAVPAAGDLAALKLDAWLGAPASWPVAPGAGVTLVGSAAKERFVGDKKVKKVLAGWKKLTLALDGGAHAVVDKDGQWAFVMANVNVGLPQKKGAPKIVHYRLMLILQAGDAATPWRVASAHFSVLR